MHKAPEALIILCFSVAVLHGAVPGDLFSVWTASSFRKIPVFMSHAEKGMERQKNRQSHISCAAVTGILSGDHG